MQTQRRQNCRALRVLVVEGDIDAAQSTALLLDLNGHEACLALDDERALRLARDSLPDVVLLDLGLPASRGYEFARRLRELEGGDQVLVIAVSWDDLGRDRTAALAAGVHLLMLKPIDPDVLLRILEQYSREPAFSGVR